MRDYVETPMELDELPIPLIRVYLGLLFIQGGLNEPPVNCGIDAASKKLKMSREGLRLSLKKLVKAGWIEMKSEKEEKGNHLPTEIRCLNKYSQV